MRDERLGISDERWGFGIRDERLEKLRIKIEAGRAVSPKPL
jgi:hypothetical protein